MPRLRSRRGGAAAAVIALLVLAAWLRLDGIGARPAWLFPDEAAEGIDAWRLLHVPGFHPLFFDDDGGREPLYAYVVAGAFRLVGDSATVLRATSAVIGTVGVAATAWALRPLGQVTRLAATAWAATSLWLVVIARDGFRNVLVPLAGALVLGGLVRLCDRPRTRTALLTGAAGGLGLWTYQPLKLVPLWVALWMLWLRRRDPARWATLRPTLRPLLAGWAVVALPMLAVAVIDPSGYFGRGVSVSAASPDQHLGDLPGHLVRTLLAFGVVGDPNSRHDVGGVALLPPAVAVVAGLGVVAAWRRRSDPRRLLVLCGLPVFLLPAAVATEGGAPHFLRLLGLASVLAALVGFGAEEVASALAGRRVRRGRLLAAVAGGTLLLTTTLQTALLERGRTPASMYDAYSGNLTQLALAGRQGATVVVDDYQGLVVDFVDRDAPPPRLRPERHAVAAGTVLVGLSRSDLDAVLGPGAADAASVVATRPDGQPSVLRLVVGSGP